MVIKFFFFVIFLSYNGYAKTIVEKISFDGNEPKYIFEDGPYGGSTGDPWTDGSGVHLNGPITAMNIRSGDKIDQIQVRYGDVWGIAHGGTGGGQTSIELNVGTDIIIVQGRGGKFINRLEFFGSDGEVYGPFGGTGGSEWVSSHFGCALQYLSGSSGDKVDSLTLHWECPDHLIEQDAEHY